MDMFGIHFDNGVLLGSRVLCCNSVFLYYLFFSNPLLPNNNYFLN